MDQNPSDVKEEPPVAPATPPPRRPGRRRGRPSRARGKPNSSDDAAARWTIRGVPPPVRDLAVRRATERGMTVGDWVAEAIVGVARAAGKSAEGANLPARERPPDLAGMVQRLDDRLSRLEQQQRSGFFGRLLGRRW